MRGAGRKLMFGDMPERCREFAPAARAPHPNPLPRRGGEGAHCDKWKSNRPHMRREALG
jgi:hypothetical protein